MPQEEREKYQSVKFIKGSIGNLKIWYPRWWPKSWDIIWWKPTPKDRVRELAKAGALIAAEIDRINGVDGSEQLPEQKVGEEEINSIINEYAIWDSITQTIIVGLKPGLAKAISNLSGGEKEAQETAYKIIKMRDAFVEKDFDEVWHWLYQMASPNFDKSSDEVWVELEQLAAGLDQTEDKTEK